jgi:hypothetical protein
MATDARATLAKLLTALQDLREKEQAILSEMSALIHGEEGIGPKVTRLKLAFSQARETRYVGQPYVFVNHPAVGAAFKRWLLAGISEAEIVERMISYVKSDDRFYVQCRHSFEVFVKVFNQLVGLPQTVANPEIERSQQRAKEMRGV